MQENWQRYCRYLFSEEQIGLQVDISKVHFEDDYLVQMESRMQSAYTQIEELEAGAIANPDEQRMVGHYWLRSPELAPDQQITKEIQTCFQDIKEFTDLVHAGNVCGERGRPFQNVLVIGIGGSSLGPRFVADALGGPSDRMKLYFIDNTDPDGIDRVLFSLEKVLDATLVVVISKSGGTIETRNGMEEIRRAYMDQGLDFARHAVSITQSGSLLDRVRSEQGWLKSFPMWDWVGGRTSVLSSVGILPLALQGVDIDSLLEGARRCDELTRGRDTRKNPSALLALMWYRMTGGQGGKQMVMLPYKDRLELFSKHLQQLVMESLGKETDLEGKTVRQGITVLGNKGSTDQHSYLQQLLDGPNNFFVTFIEVLRDRRKASGIIAEYSTSGDYLQAFLLGTRKALAQKGKESITITIGDLTEFSLGVLLGLFERTVSIYALLININAYHQPAVELGKKGAGEVIGLKNEALEFLRAHRESSFTVEELAEGIEGKTGREVDREILFKILSHAASNPDHRVIVLQDRIMGTGSTGKELFCLAYKAE